MADDPPAVSNFSIIRSIALALPLHHWHVNMVFTFLTEQFLNTNLRSQHA